MTKEIPLTKGKVALVDDDDYEALNAHNWCAHQVQAGCYAVRSGSIKGGQERRMLLMHREIMGAPEGLEVDHINGDTLDNRRENLRLATKAQNAANRRKTKAPTSSQYLGVSWHPHTRKWTARIAVGTRKHYLGVYSDEREAALAYDRAARHYRGEFAVLNFPGAQ